MVPVVTLYGASGNTLWCQSVKTLFGASGNTVWCQWRYFMVHRKQFTKVVSPNPNSRDVAACDKQTPTLLNPKLLT